MIVFKGKPLNTIKKFKKVLDKPESICYNKSTKQERRIKQ